MLLRIELVRSSLRRMADAMAMLAAALDNIEIESVLEGTPILLSGAGGRPPSRACATARNDNTAPGHGPSSGTDTLPEHGPTSSVPAAKKARYLKPHVSIEASENFARSLDVSMQVVKAEDVKNNVLPKLAEEHLRNFRDALGSECTRRLAPNREVFIATSCTGSGAEYFTLLAIVKAFRNMYPRLRFTYVFHCEKYPMKRKFVRSLHQHLGKELAADSEPCFFDDISKIVSGEAACCVHADEVQGKRCHERVISHLSTCISVRPRAQTLGQERAK